MDHSTGQVVWTPSRLQIERANVTRLMRRYGIETFEELRARSVADPEWFWAAVVDDLDIAFTSPWTRLVDISRGPQWATWFEGATVNAAYNVTRHGSGSRAESTAVVWEGEDGSTTTLSYADLKRSTAQAAGALAQLGVTKGDAVGLYLPMIPEAVIAFLACASIGAVVVPLFSGFAPEAAVVRLRDAGVTVLVTADGYLRRGRVQDLKSAADRVAVGAGIQKVLVVSRFGRCGTWDPERDVAWDKALDRAQPIDPVPLPAETPMLIAYTSGTTGRPKGSVHVHGGWVVKVAEELAYQFDVGPGDRFHWVTDMGWIVGAWMTIGVGTLGATLVLYEGSPDHPEPDRLWRLVERHGVTVLGVSPTLIRSLRAHDDHWLNGPDLSSVRILGTTGEPIDPSSWWWLFDQVGGRRCPVINISGGTEVGVCFLSPHPVNPLKVASVHGPALGLDVDIFDTSGRSAEVGQMGELVCRGVWPGMTRGLWRDADRYLKTYWARWDDVWVHGDWAVRDEDGFWFLHGRSDDTLNVAGKRVGPAEVEAALTAHDAVIEAAVVGVPDPVRGEALCCYCVIAPDHGPTDVLRAELADLVVQRMGKPFRPRMVRFVTALPKTRSAKVVRRAIRAIAMGEDPGDISTLEDPGALSAVRNPS